MEVDIVGGTLVGYFSLSGAPLLDLSESAGRDHSVTVHNKCKVFQ